MRLAVIAEGHHRAHLRALIVHQAGDDGEDAQRRDDQKEEGKDDGHLAHVAHVGVEQFAHRLLAPQPGILDNVGLKDLLGRRPGLQDRSGIPYEEAELVGDARGAEGLLQPGLGGVDHPVVAGRGQELAAVTGYEIELGAGDGPLDRKAHPSRGCQDLDHVTGHDVVVFRQVLLHQAPRVLPRSQVSALLDKDVVDQGLAPLGQAYEQAVDVGPGRKGTTAVHRQAGQHRPHPGNGRELALNRIGSAGRLDDEIVVL